MGPKPDRTCRRSRIASSIGGHENTALRPPVTRCKSRSAPPTRLPGVASGPRHRIPPRRIRYGRGRRFGEIRLPGAGFRRAATDNHPTNAALSQKVPTRYRNLSARIRFYRPGSNTRPAINRTPSASRWLCHRKTRLPGPTTRYSGGLSVPAERAPPAPPATRHGSVRLPDPRPAGPCRTPRRGRETGRASPA